MGRDVDVVVKYRVKTTRDGGNTWLTYRNNLTDTTTSLNGLYAGKAYTYRLIGIGSNGKQVGDAVSFDVIPVKFDPVVSSYETGDTISVSIKGAEGSSGTVSWYKVDGTTEVEIEEARGSLEYTPTDKSDIRIKLTGTGASEGTGTVVDVEYISPPVLNVVNYDSSTRTAELSWARDNNASGYRVKILKNDTWLTYYKELPNTDVNEAPTCEVRGLYPLKDYAFRVFTIDQNGKTADVYNVVNFSPFKATPSTDVFTVGDAISYDWVASEYASATPSWFYVKGDGDVEIEGTAGETSIVPQYGNYPIKLQLTGTGNSKYEVLDLYFAAPNVNVSVASIDSEQGKVGFAWDTMLDATSYKITVTDANSAVVSTTTVSSTEGTVENLTSGTDYTVTVQGMNAEDQIVGTSNPSVFSFVNATLNSRVWNDNDTISVDVTSSSTATPEIRWYSVDMTTHEVTGEITELQNMTSFTPSEAMDVRIVVTGSGTAAGQEIVLDAYYREAPSTVVTSLEDNVDLRDGVVTLREAIEHYAKTGDTITFDNDLNGQITINHGAFSVDKGITVDGATNDGYAQITISGNYEYAHFNVQAEDVKIQNITLRDSQQFYSDTCISSIVVAENASLTLDNVTITDCYGTLGGAIHVSSNSELNMNECTVSSCSAFETNVKGEGSAIYQSQGSTVSITDSKFSNNTLYGELGGAISVAGDPNDSTTILNITGGTFKNNIVDGYGYGKTYGGAIIMSTGVVTLDGVTFKENKAKNGGAIQVNGGELRVKNGSLFEKNEATEGDGGAINVMKGKVIVEATTFTNNKATSSGGAVFVEEAEFIANDVYFGNNSVGSDGGAIFVRSGKATVSIANIIENTATFRGGAVSVIKGTVELTSISFEGNKGGAASTAVLQIGDNQTLEGDVTVELNNSLIEGSEQGTFLINNQNGRLTISNSTIAENAVEYGVYTSGSLTINNSIIWNTGANVIAVEGSGSFTANNVITQAGKTSGVSGSSNTFWECGMDEAPYYDRTYQLKPNWKTEEGVSPIDSGDNSYVKTEKDRNDMPRIVNGTVDLGAFEYQGVSIINATLDEAFEDYFEDFDL